MEGFAYLAFINDVSADPSDLECLGLFWGVDSPGLAEDSTWASGASGASGASSQTFTPATTCNID